MMAPCDRCGQLTANPPHRTFINCDNCEKGIPPAADRPVENELRPLISEMAKQASLGHKRFCVGMHQHDSGEVEEEWIDWSEAFRRISEVG